MAKMRKKNSGCLTTLLLLPVLLFLKFLDYAMNYKPTPLIGGNPGRKKKRKC